MVQNIHFLQFIELLLALSKRNGELGQLRHLTKFREKKSMFGCIIFFKDVVSDIETYNHFSFPV